MSKTSTATPQLKNTGDPMTQTVKESVTDLDDLTSQKDVNVTDFANDVDTQELIRSGNVTIRDMVFLNLLETHSQERRHREQQHDQRSRLQAQLDAITVRNAQNAATHDHNVNQQETRHVDHTLIDLHGE